MAEVEKERRRQPLRRALLSLGNAATWTAVAAIAIALVLAISISARPLAEKAWPAASPATATPEPMGIGWQVVSEQAIASPYYWVVEGQSGDRTPQLSPDGTKVAYLPRVDGQASDIDRLVVRDLATGKDLDLTPEEGYSYTSVHWSPDSKSLAFVKYRVQDGQGTPSELWRIDADGANATLLYRRGPCGPGALGPGLGIMRWSGDGQSIVVNGTIFDCLGPGSALCVRADGSGTAEALTTQTAADLGARSDEALLGGAISPSDDYVLWSVQTDGLLAPPAEAPAGGTSLVLYDLESQESRVLCSLEGGISLSDGSISPEGEWIAFRVFGRSADGTTQEPPRVWTVRREGSALHQVLLDGWPAPGYMPGPLWAGGGRAYFNQSPEVSATWICEVDAAGGQAGLIAHRQPARDLVSVSRDGRRLLLIRGAWDEATLYLLELAPGPAPAPTVAPTAQPVAAAPEFAAVRDLFTPPPSAGFYRVSPDGAWVLYPVPGGRTAGGGTVKPHLEAYATASGEVATLEIVAAESNLAAEGQYTWFPDSCRLLVVTGGSAGQILVKELGSQAAQTLAKAPTGSAGFGEAAISPDGARIAYTVLYPDGPAPVPKVGIHFMNVDGSGGGAVEPDYFIGRLAWAPDSAQVVYFKGKGGTPPEDGDAYVVDVDKGEARRLFPRLRLAAWSPSGTQALWLSEPADERGQADLYLTAWPAAGEPQVVAHGVAMSGVAWAGSDDWFVYSQGGLLYMAPAAAPNRLTLLTPARDVADAPLWVPGKGLIYRAVRDGRAVLRLLPPAEPAGALHEFSAAGLTIEEHAVAEEATGFRSDVEGTGWLGPGILDRRRAWREPAPAEKVAASNEALRLFGYRLEPKEKPGWGRPFYDLYQGDQVLLTDLDTVWPASVNAAGDDLALLVYQFNGPYTLVRPSGTEKWDPSQHLYQPPVFVGRDLVSVTGIPELRNVTVLRGVLPAYTAFVDWPPASNPVKGLWSWQGHWLLEVSGRLIQDGMDLNRELGYDEIFGYRLLDGKPCYFFSQGGRVGISYDGVTLPQQYEKVRHYECCSGAAYNPGGNDSMAWFFGLRDGDWYYVEMGRYGAG